MSHRKMSHFSAGALLLLLSLFDDLVLGEISDDFHQCLGFFYNNIPPSGITGDQYQPICQRYKNAYRFATLYNRQHRAPVYSAYTINLPLDAPKPRNEWKYEPQLVSKDENSEMKDFPRDVGENIKESQAVLYDYSSSTASSDPEYTKGHLAPGLHQKTLEDREATYTLTNIVPQREDSNSGPWERLEKDVLQKFKQYCKGTIYVITGALPFETVRWLKEERRVSIPEYMWSAYCCPSYKHLPKSEKSFFPTYAAVGRNDPGSGNDIVPRADNSNGYDVKKMSLQNRLNLGISLFNRLV